MKLQEKIYRQRLRERKIIVAFALVIIVAFAITSCGATSQPGKLISETYIVKPGDTLWDISNKYMAKNTYGPRDIREFYYGIIEANWDTTFYNRPVGLILPGDKLVINYFIKE